MADPSATATVHGTPIPDRPDLVRMRADRLGRLRAQLDAQGVDALLLLGTSTVTYATGAHLPATDSGRAGLLRTVAAVGRQGDPLVASACPDLDDGAAALAALVREHLDLAGGAARVAADEVPHALLRALVGVEFVPASPVLGPAKVTKTVDELACIRDAQLINEKAMLDVYAALRPGVRQHELSAIFLRRIFELGADANGIDPIFQPMPAALSEGPWTVHGGLAFPTARANAPLRDGDVVWVDTGIHVAGYASDFGRTWIVGNRPSSRQTAQYRRWREVMDAVLAVLKPGATGRDLVQVATDANGGERPWIPHFYLAHGVGTDSAEMPLIGTDLGDAFDEQLVLSPGMVLVLEPVIWDDGAAGYRAEEIYAVTDDGFVHFGDHPYAPFEDA